jgi:hypothetical protein
VLSDRAAAQGVDASPLSVYSIVLPPRRPGPRIHMRVAASLRTAARRFARVTAECA